MEGQSEKEIKVHLSADVENMRNLLNMLTKPIEDKLKVADSVLLVALGGVWYVSEILRRYPNISKLCVVGCDWEKEYIKLLECDDNRVHALCTVSDFVDDNKRTSLNSMYMKQFDCVIANPPFSMGRSATQLHLEIVQCVLESNMMKDDGEFVSIQPVNWLLSPIDVKYNIGSFKRFGLVRDCIKGVDVVSKEEVREFFGDMDAINNLAIYTFRANGASVSSFSLQSFLEEYGRVDETGFFEKVVCSCYEKKFPSFNDVAVAHEKAEKYYCYISEVHGNIGKSDFFDVISPEYDRVRKKGNGKSTRVINFESEEAAENFRHSVVDGVFYKYVNWCYKKNLWQTLNKYPWMGDAKNPRTGLIGYESEWTDDDLFSYFGFGKDVQAKVKENLLKSKRSGTIGNDENN